jgi:uncharacterized protein (DUF1778 family)
VADDDYRTVLPAEEFDRLLAELDRPPAVIPALLAAANKARRFVHRDEAQDA